MGSYRFTTGVQFYWNGLLYEVIRYLAGEMRMMRIVEVLTDRVVELSVSILEIASLQGDLTFVRKTRVNRNKETSSIPNPEEQNIDLSDYPTLYVAKARFRLKVILPLLTIEQPERTKAMVLARVKEVSTTEENPLNFAVSERSVYRWMEDYEYSGEDIRSLIPNHARSGGPGKSRLDIDLLNIVKGAINEYILKREKFTIDDVLAICAARIEEENRFRAQNEKVSVPSRTTIARLINALNLKDRLEARNGKRKARKMLQQAGKIDFPEHPLERVEIDHTRTDMIVIDEMDNLPLGRLTLSYMLDCATRYPLGYYLGFEPPSYYAVLECLNGLITNDKFCMVRNGKLKLHHWRRALRLRQNAAYSPQEGMQRGGQDETTPVAGETDGARERGWAETVGSSLPARSGDCPSRPTEPGDPKCGGEPCK